ncbi:unnamed protein product [Cladocopium goreaui]|uniref:Kinesin-like protein 2 n=1 Tax=Cladocopium goreaui TaxID=2562237 RepID=A0A9P1DQS5_9DINO|nr:unnamed protein product [Cladocopium goreaui]
MREIWVLHPVVSTGEDCGGGAAAPHETIAKRAVDQGSETRGVHHKETEFVVQVPRGSDTVNNQVEEYSFRFARVFGPQATQREVFDVVAKVGAPRARSPELVGIDLHGSHGATVSMEDLVLGALDGVNCSIFAYGQWGSQTDAVTGCDGRRTGSGKTYTICWGLRAGSLVRKIKIFQLLPVGNEHH